MKNIQISDNDLKGRRFNGHDLHFYLQKKEIESEQFVWNNESNDPTTHKIAKRFKNRENLHKILKDVNSTMSSQSMYYPFSHQMMFEKKFLEADIVHYHLIHNNFFNISDFPILSKLKPTVWTLHDPWALTGHCIHPMGCDKWKTGCGDCPLLDSPKSLEFDTTALNWELKKQYYSESKFDLIVSSRWMYDMVKESPLLKDKPLHYIPFGLNLDIFKPMESTRIKKKFGIDPDSIVLCFRAMKSEYKGLDIILECLDKMKVDKPITLLVFNYSKGLLERIQNKYHIIELGWVNDDKLLVEAYNAADIFLMPSSAESFGMMAMEAMACGKVTVVMRETALEEVVFPDQDGGIVVPQGDVSAFISQVSELIQNDEKRYFIGKKARELVEKHYSADRYVSDIIKVYKEVIDRRKKDNEAAYLIEQLSKFSSNPEKVYLDDIIISFQYRRLIKRVKENKFVRFVYFDIVKLLKDEFLSKVFR